MTTPAHRLIQDQNLNVLYNNKGSTLGRKTDVAKTGKKGGLGGRKALNDISNSRKPSVLQSTKRDNTTNVVSVGKDLCAASTATTNDGGKVKFSKPTEKGPNGGRKALTDLTNSVLPSSQPVPRTARKSSAVTEENVPSSIVEERFLHNHQECIKAQMKAVDLDFFMKSVGLDNGNNIQLRNSIASFQCCTLSSNLHSGISDIPAKLSLTAKSSSMKFEIPAKFLEMEVMAEQPLADQVHKFGKSELAGYCSPACLSPKSPKPPPYMNWEDENICDLMVIESPKLLNP